MAAGTGHPRIGADRGEPLQRAAFALNAKHPEEAQQIAEEILRRDPRNARALHILGFALLMQGRAEAAVAPLEAAARGRHDPEIETQLALALSQLGRRDDALSRLKRASKRQPPYAPAFHGLGSLLFAMERYDEAIEALRRGVAVAPMMPEMSIQLGNVFLQRRKYEDARAAFGQALSISPDVVRRAARHGQSALCDRPERKPPPIVFAVALESGPTMTAYGSISDIVCCGSASARPATSAFALRRAAIRSAMAGRCCRSLHRAAAALG